MRRWKNEIQGCREPDTRNRRCPYVNRERVPSGPSITKVDYFLFVIIYLRDHRSRGSPVKTLYRVRQRVTSRVVSTQSLLTSSSMSQYVGNDRRRTEGTEGRSEGMVSEDHSGGLIDDRGFRNRP